MQRERREFVSLMTARVGDAYMRKPFFVDGATDLVTLCRELAAHGLADALVRDGDRLGIFTTTNLRDALLRPEPPPRWRCARSPLRACSRSRPTTSSSRRCC